MAKKKKPAQRQVNVRMEKKLHDLIAKDAKDGHRSKPAQCRLILRKYYKAQLDAKKRRS